MFERRAPQAPMEPIPQEAPRAPTMAEWEALDEAGRERAIQALLDSVSEEEIAEREAMAEGDWHLEAKIGARTTLRRFFEHFGRSLYVGADIKVYYPGEKGFTPDLIAVTDVEVKPRHCWMVSREGKGVDLALEVHDQGSWRKDYVDNVARYAALGIGEYFIFDVGRHALRGFRLPTRESRGYEPIRPIRGRLPSQVLGLDLVVEDAALRFYHGTARLLDLEDMLGQEQARAGQEQARADQEQARADTAMRRMQDAVLYLLETRQIPLSAEGRRQVRAATDPDLLDRWLRRALAATDEAQLFSSD